MSDAKLRVARAQLGTATQLFIDDRDPISVQALACGGSEIAEGLAEHSNLPTLSTHIMSANPRIDMGEIRALRNQYWNGIKHFYKRNGKVRSDESLLSGLTDQANDVTLFSGWLDYGQVARKLPVAAQVFQVWWYATNESRMNPAADPEPYRTMFPSIALDGRQRQKERLRAAAIAWSTEAEILSDPATDIEPLVSRTSY